MARLFSDYPVVTKLTDSDVVAVGYGPTSEAVGNIRITDLAGEIIKRGGTFITEIPAGLVNGVNTVFTLSKAPTKANAILVMLNGLGQAQGGDYALSGTTVNFVTAPSGADVIMAAYTY